MSELTDDFAGLGGSYQVDPVTGVRTLVERTQTEAPPAPLPEQLTENPEPA